MCGEQRAGSRPKASARAFLASKQQRPLACKGKHTSTSPNNPAKTNCRTPPHNRQHPKTRKATCGASTWPPMSGTACPRAAAPRRAAATAWPSPRAAARCCLAGSTTRAATSGVWVWLVGHRGGGSWLHGVFYCMGWLHACMRGVCWRGREHGARMLMQRANNTVRDRSKHPTNNLIQHHSGTTTTCGSSI